MPWVQALQPNKGDDVFDEEADDRHLLQQEWKSTMEKRVKEGYRDGIDAGKADSLQEGFNHGFKEGVAIMMTSGKLKGALCALKCWSYLRDYSSNLTTEIHNLQEAVARYEENVLKSLTTTASLQPHPGDLADSIQDMGLNQNVQPQECLESKKVRFAECDAQSDGACCKSSSGATSSYPGYCRKAQECKDSEQLKQLVQHTLSLAKQMSMSEELLQHIEQLQN